MIFKINTTTDFTDKKFSANDILVLKVIEFCCDLNSNKETDISTSEICDILKLTFPTVNTSVKKLIKHNKIKIQIKNNFKTKKTITIC